MSTFSQMRLKPDLLQRSCLPDIDYPMPVEALDEVLTSGGQISYAELLYWLQEFSAEQKEGWQNLEAAMLRLAELIAPQDERERLIAEGDTWFLEIGPVDLTSTVITIQRGRAGSDQRKPLNL